MKKYFSKVWNAFDGLAYDTLWSGFFDGVSLIATLFSFVVIQKVLTTDYYGSYGSLYALVGPFGALGYSGPGLALLKARIRDKEPPNETLRSYLSLAILSGVVLTFFAVILALIVDDRLTFAEILGIVLSELLATSIIFVVANLVQSASGYAAMIRVKLGALFLKFFVLFVLTMLDSRIDDQGFLFFGMEVPFVEKFEALTIRNLGFGYFITFATYAIWLLIVHLPKHGYTLSFGRPQKKTVTSTVSFAIPMASSQLQDNGDKVALQYYGDADTGIYNAAYRIVMLGTKPLSAIESAAFHRFLPDEGDDKRGLHLKRTIRFTGLMFPISLCLVAILYFFKDFVFDILIDVENDGAREIVPWLLFFIPLMALANTPLNGLIGLDRAKERSYIYISSSLFSILWYVILIPDYGWQGAVIATIIGEIYLAVISWLALVYYQRKTDQEIMVRD